jgi:AAA15 family ATPase/GTPase
MIIEFTFSNYRSFRDPTTLSMVAANITSEDKSVDQNNQIPILQNLKLLNSAVVYGKNASGKSNLVSAIAFMRQMVLNSSRETQAEEPVHVDTFRLSSETEGKPASFEMVFLIDDKKYRYGFETTTEKIQKEWLYVTPTIKPARLFYREGDMLEINPRSFKEGRGLEQRTRPNALFLSVVAQFNGPISRQVQGWFKRLGVISGLSDMSYKNYTINKFMKDSQRKEDIVRFVCALDLDIEDIQGEKIQSEQIKFPSDMPDEVKNLLLKNTDAFVVFHTYHKKYDHDLNVIGMERLLLEENESEGTKKLFYLAGPILDTLTTSRVLIVDEMEARMHPLITKAIINLFKINNGNIKNSQLIFTTHDTNLLDRDQFRRDQIWFAEKDRFGSSHLYSLVEFKPRYDSSFEKDYLRGRYGGIPYPGEIASTVQHAMIVGKDKGEDES